MAPPLWLAWFVGASMATLAPAVSVDAGRVSEWWGLATAALVLVVGLAVGQAPVLAVGLVGLIAHLQRLLGAYLDDHPAVPVVLGLLGLACLAVALLALRRGAPGR